MLSYNNTHIFTGYLKQLLSTFSLPTCKIYTSDFARYVEQHGKEDPRVLESFDSLDKSRPAVRINYLKNNELCHYKWNYKTDNKTYWKRSSESYYDSSKVIRGLTRTLNSPGINYDTKTHEYLGDYLRFIRDYHDVNLMSLYNCFSDRICNNIEFSFDLNYYHKDKAPVYVRFNSRDPKYRIYAIPVKLFANYTIAIDCGQGIEMFCGLYNTNIDMTTGKADDLAVKTYKKVQKALFNQPFLYDNLSVDHWPTEDDFTTNPINGKKITRTDVFTRWDLINREQDLKLFIKVPVSCRSTITILEGNYVTYNNYKYAPIEGTLYGRYEETPSTIWYYDETLKTFKTTIADEEYALGVSDTAASEESINTFTGIGPVKISANPFCVKFVEGEAILNSNEDNTFIANATKPETGKVYKLALYQEAEERLYYLNGCMISPGYFAGASNVSDDIKVVIEPANGGYRLKLREAEGAEKYINIIASGRVSTLTYQNNHSVLNFNTAKTGDKVDLNNYPFKPISKLQLLAFNTGESYPFADRLIEYLSGSAITPIDEIHDNIKRVQEVMKQNKNHFKITGLWEPKMQNILYDYMMNSGPVKVVTLCNDENDSSTHNKELGREINPDDYKGPTKQVLKDYHQGYHPRLGHATKSNLYDILGYADKDTENWYASWKKENNKATVDTSLQSVDIYVNEHGKSLWDI